MKLILERSQRAGGVLSNKNIFTLKVQAEVSQAERDLINKLSLADDVLYQSHEIVDPGSGIVGLAWRMYTNAKIDKLIVRELVNGKTFEAENIVVMKGLEGQIMEAAQNLKLILDAAATFGGREIIEL